MKEKNDETRLRKQGEARYIWKETIFHFVFFKDVSDVWNIVMSIWSEETKSVWMGSIVACSIIGIFKKNGMIPGMTKEELGKILSKYPDLRDVFVDWTERSIKRNANNEEQKKEYSWKKKRHTIKNLIVTWDNKVILWVSKSEAWSKHDYTMLKESGFMEYLWKYVIWLDTWFLGIKKDYPWTTVMMPKKNSKLHKLTIEEKVKNKTIAWIRIIIEHIIGKVKNFWILRNAFRNRTTGNFRTVKQNMKDMVMKIICWLYNLKLFIA